MRSALRIVERRCETTHARRSGGARPAERPRRRVATFVRADPHRPHIGPPEAQRQIRAGALARAGAPDQGPGLAARDRKTPAGQPRAALAAIAEPDALE